MPTPPSTCATPATPPNLDPTCASYSRRAITSKVGRARARTCCSGWGPDLDLDLVVYKGGPGVCHVLCNPRLHAVATASPRPQPPLHAPSGQRTPPQWQHHMSYDASGLWHCMPMDVKQLLADTLCSGHLPGLALQACWAGATRTAPACTAASSPPSSRAGGARSCTGRGRGCASTPAPCTRACPTSRRASPRSRPVPSWWSWWVGETSNLQRPTANHPWLAARAALLPTSRSSCAGLAHPGSLA